MCFHSSFKSVKGARITEDGSRYIVSDAILGRDIIRPSSLLTEFVSYFRYLAVFRKGVGLK